MLADVAISYVGCDGSVGGTMFPSGELCRTGDTAMEVDGWPVRI